MKNIIRAFVLVLAVTGVAATSNTSSASTKNIVVVKTSAMPIPMCPPDSPNACNIRGGW